MGFQKEVRGHLAVERHAALEPWNSRKEPVEIPSTAPEAATVKGESYARYEGKVQFVRRQNGTSGKRFRNPKLTRNEVRSGIQNPAGDVLIGIGHMPRQRYSFAGRNGFRDEC